MKIALFRSQNWSRLFLFGILLSCFAFTAFNSINTDPIARLGLLTGGIITAGDFEANEGLNAVIENENHVTECMVTEFHLARLPYKQDPVISINRDANFNDRSKRLVEKAATGDAYYFDNVRAKCPGDKEDRKINSLVFKIK